MRHACKHRTWCRKESIDYHRDGLGRNGNGRKGYDSKGME
jgi:hypothetical protein